VDYIIYYYCFVLLLLYSVAYLIADTKPAKPAIKSSTLPRTASQGKHLKKKPKKLHIYSHVTGDENQLTGHFVHCALLHTYYNYCAYILRIIHTSHK